MPLLPRKSSLGIVLLLSSTLGLWSALSMAQKKSPSPGSKTASAAAPQPIAVHEFQVEGVDVALMEATRTAPDVVIVKWEYRNKTSQPQQLATGSKGWSDPYRLSINTYLLDEDTKIKIPVSRDDKRVPVAAEHGTPNQLTIAVPANKTLKNWAKYIVPTTTKKITVVITGTEPFEGVDVKEAEQKPGS